MKPMKHILSAFAGLAIALTVVAPPPASAGGFGATSSTFHAKSPLRYRVFQYQLPITTAASAADVIIGSAAGPCVIKDVLYSQGSAGTGGTSWTITVKKNGTTISTTDGILALAAGANKSVNTLKSPMGSITAPSGSTKPVLKTDGTATLAIGDVLSANWAVTGTYSPGFNGVISIYCEPTW